MINIKQFISNHVTKRSESMFASDIEENRHLLSKAIQHKTVLVIGGAGTIGSSFIRALLPFEPKTLVVVDINENGLTELTRDIRSTKGMPVPQDYVTYPMSYSDAVFFKMLKRRGGFDIVANFSAHKHVRSEKDIFSVEALLRNNVIHAKQLLEALVHFTPQHFFCVSTDKAANPVNIMGGSKKIMEDMIMAYAAKYRVTTARFANVAFSNGSLPQGFLERVSKKQPISAPNDVTRYFVSPEESGQICLLACILGNSGEIYFPKLKKEEVMTFSEMATKLLQEKGFELEYCSSDQEAIDKSASGFEVKYPVHFSGSNTTGEKPYEEFFTATEKVDLKRHKALGVVLSGKAKSIDDVNVFIETLIHAFEDDTTKKEDIVSLMKDFLVNFNHNELGKSLDSKM